MTSGKSRVGVSTGPGLVPRGALTNIDQGPRMPIFGSLALASVAAYVPRFWLPYLDGSRHA
jgi:hypothetical protein